MQSAPTRIRQMVADLLNCTVGANVFLERPVDEPIDEDMMPAVVVRAGAFEFERQPGDQNMAWEGEFIFDIFVASGGFYTITEKHAEIACNIAQQIESAMDDVNSLGGMCTWFEPLGISPEEDAIADVGGVVLRFRVRFETRASDWNAIVGPGGSYF